MEIRDLNTISYVVVITHSSNPEIEYYYAGPWPNPDLHRKYTEGYKISVYNEVYYTTELAVAEIFDSPVRAQKICKELKEVTWGGREIWYSARALPVRQEEIFKAKLKGPGKVGDGNAALETRAKVLAQRYFDTKNHDFEVLDDE